MVERSGEMALATTVSLAVAAGPRSARQGAGRDRRPLRGAPGRRARSGLLRTRLPAPRHPVRGALEALRRGDRAGASAARARLRAARHGPWRDRRESRCGSGAGAHARASLASRRAGDGWLASAYNTTPERFSAARDGSGAGARGSRARPDRLPQRARDDVDLGVEGPRGGRSRARRRPGADPEAGSRRASRAGLRRSGRSTAPSSSRATPRPAASASTCGRWAMSARQLELVAEHVAPQVSGALGRP